MESANAHNTTVLVKESDLTAFVRNVLEKNRKLRALKDEVIKAGL